MGFGSGHTTLNFLIANPLARIIIFTTMEEEKEKDEEGKHNTNTNTYTSTSTSINNTTNKTSAGAANATTATDSNVGAAAAAAGGGGGGGTNAAFHRRDPLFVQALLSKVREMFPHRDIETRALGGGGAASAGGGGVGGGVGGGGGGGGGIEHTFCHLQLKLDPFMSKTPRSERLHLNHA